MHGLATDQFTAAGLYQLPQLGHDFLVKLWLRGGGFCLGMWIACAFLRPLIHGG